MSNEQSCSAEELSRPLSGRAPEFYVFIDRILSHEGGYVSPEEAKRINDPGGETKFGISKRSYPNVDIKNLTREGAVEIYGQDFWDPVVPKGMSPAIAFQLLDAAVNSGPTQAIRWLQRAVGVADDGKFGPISLKALQAAAPEDVIMRFLAERLDFMTRLSNWPSASRGWARRIAQNLKYGAGDTP